MILGVVKGQVYSTINHPDYDGRRILLVDRIRPDGSEDGGYLIAVDAVDAGVGQTVLIVAQGMMQDLGTTSCQISAYSEEQIRAALK